MELEKLLSPAEVEEETGISAHTIRRWCKEGKIGTVEDGEFRPLEKISVLGRQPAWAIPDHLVETIKGGVENGVDLVNTKGGMFRLPQQTRPLHSTCCEYVSPEGKRCYNMAMNGSRFCKDHRETEVAE